MRVSLELRYFRWAVVASQHRSLRKAAEALNVRQSTLSRCLRDLEHELGAVLFERTNGGTRPTSEGWEFLKSARQIIEEAELIAARLRTRSRGESGRLTIGVQASLSAGNLRATLIEYHRRFPNVETCLVDGSSDHLISDLVNASVDIAFLIEGKKRWSGRSLGVWSERLVSALPERHSLTSNEVLYWHQMKGQTIIVPRHGPGPELLKVLSDNLICSDNCQIQRHDVSLDRLLTLVGAGMGILLALEGATGTSYQDVAFREVHDRDGPIRLNFYAAWRHGNSNPSLRPFLDMLRERYPDLSGDPAPA